MSEFSKLKKDDVVSVADDLTIELATKNEEIDLLKTDFQKQMEEMKQMIADMASSQKAPKQQFGLQKEPTLDVTCYLLGRNNISIDKETVVQFESCGSVEDLTHSEIKALLKFGKNKSLFSDGLLVIEDKEASSALKVKPRRIMTDDYIISVFNLENKEFLEELKVITNNKSSSPATHSFVYRSAYLYGKGEIKGLGKELADTFKDYLGKGIADVYIDDDIL